MTIQESTYIKKFEIEIFSETQFFVEQKTDITKDGIVISSETHRKPLDQNEAIELLGSDIVNAANDIISILCQN